MQEATYPSTQIATPEKMSEIVNRVCAAVDDKQDYDRRKAEREWAFLPITVKFYDDKFDPVGEEVEAISRDVSSGGLGVLCNVAAPGSKAIVRFPTLETAPLVCNVCYSRPIGPFFHIGMSFRLDAS